MSSDFFMFDEPLHSHQQNPNPIALFNSDTLFQTESSIDTFLQEFSDNPTSIPATEAQKQSLEEISQILLSDSSPSHQLESLSLCPEAQLAHLQSSPVSEIKLEESQGQIAMGFGSLPGSNGGFCGSQSYGGFGGEGLMRRFMERSYSYGGFSCDEGKQGTLFRPPFGGGLFESNENGGGQFGGHMRRVCSTGDLPVLRSNQATNQNVGSSLLGSESTTTTFMEEANFKVGRYSAEERKERIDRYKAKRTQRNFNKTIKYACRKTLADNRLRVRGRFARNDEGGDTVKSVARYDDEDELSVDGLHEEGDHHEGKMNEYGLVKGDQRRHYLNHFESYFSQFDKKNIGY